MTAIYRTFGYLGLVSVLGAELFGFRYDPAAPARNYLYNLLLYAVFIVPHLVMTRTWYKQAVCGWPAGTAAERRVYIVVSISTWLAVWYWQFPLPGASIALPNAEVWTFAADLLFLWCVVLSFQGVTFEMLDGLLGVPGAQGSYSHGAETPLFTEGAYARVRHPMYQAAVLAGVASLVMHPHAAQLFWIMLLGGTLLSSIPVEEAQLLAARGDEYRQYQQRTPYRLFRGIW